MQYKKKKASILAFTLVMMGILLAAGLSLMGATLVGQRVAMESRDSVQALQKAEVGTDVVISQLAAASSSDDLTTAVGCMGGEVAGPDYVVTFLDENGDPLDCAASVSEVESVKSVGTFANTNRAVEVALAASIPPGTTIEGPSCMWGYDYRMGSLSEAEVNSDAPWGCVDGDVPACPGGGWRDLGITHRVTSVACAGNNVDCYFGIKFGTTSASHPVTVGVSYRICVKD